MSPRPNANMDLGDKALIKRVGQCFMVGFNGHEIDDNITSLIRDYGVGYIVLFQRNVRDAAQLRSLTAGLQRIAQDAGHTRPLYIAIDQENGLVTRIKPPILAQLPGSMSLGASTLPGMAREVSQATGEALRTLGINMNLAPICDVNSEPKNPVIGVRSPSDDAHAVGQISSDIAAALQAEGICPVVKHFPGHGDTAVDSHYGLPVISKSMDGFAGCEIVPFQRAIAEGVPAVMTAHIAIPSLDDSGLPASVSAKATQLLRERLAFQGLLMSDCLEMDGVRSTFGTVRAAEMAFTAGTDCLMVCHTYQVQCDSIRQLSDRIRDDAALQGRLREAETRTAQLKDRFLTWVKALQTDMADLSTMNASHAALARRSYESSATLVRQRSGLLPLISTARVVFLYPSAPAVDGGAVQSGEVKTRIPYTPTTFGDVLASYVTDLHIVPYHEDFEPLPQQLDNWRAADAVILVTRNATQAEYQRKLGLTLAAEGLDHLIIVATCDPYDFLEEPSIQTYAATYEPTVESFEPVIKILFGHMQPAGKLPVQHRAR